MGQQETDNAGPDKAGQWIAGIFIALAIMCAAIGALPTRETSKPQSVNRRVTVRPDGWPTVQQHRKSAPTTGRTVQQDLDARRAASRQMQGMDAWRQQHSYDVQRSV